MKKADEMSFYKFIATKIGLGVGAQNQAFLRPQSVPVDGFAPGNHLVAGQLNPLSQGAILMGQTVVPVSLLGDNGAAISGQIVSSPLGRPVQKG